ncbi:MAG: hypothetical protein L6R42_003663, partial [Xanthoria sp. 1 TBL-2021]
MDTPEDHFSSVLEAFQQISKGKHLPHGFDLRGKHTWEEVFEAASAAEAKADADGSKNLFRRSGRGIQNYALAMSRVVDLIPGGDYTSALCGGLKIAFSVAGQMKEKREAIIETFHQIPKTLEEAADRLEEYSDDQRLFEEVTKLYLVVLEAIESMLQWLVDKSTCKSQNFVFDAGLGDVEKQIKIVWERAATLQHQQIGHIDTNVKRIASKADRIQLSTQNTEMMTGSLQQIMSITYARLEAQNGMIAFLADRAMRAEWQRKRDARQHEREAQQHKREARIHSRELRDIKKQLHARNVVEQSPTHARSRDLEADSSSILLLSQDRLRNLMAIDPQMSFKDIQIVMVEG